jgi:CrcB protein
MRALLVGFGGFAGAILRYAVSGWVHRVLGVESFPVGTLAVNVSGCLVLGALAGLAEFRGGLTPDSRALLFIGMLGGYTTFSTFGYETFRLLSAGETAAAALNATSNLVAGVLAVWLGFVLARLLVG